MSLTAATRAETTKQFTTSMWWILAIVLVAYVGFTAAILGLVLGGAASGSLPGDAPPLPEEGLSAALYSVATAVGYVFPLLIGTLVVTAEFRHQTLTPTFLATPKRGRVLIAKLAVGALLGILFAVIGIVASVGPSAAFLASFGLDTDLTSVETWAMFGRMLLAFILWALIGVGIGALVRNQVGAIVGGLVYLFVVEPVIRQIPATAGAYKWMPGGALEALTATFQGPELLGVWQGGLLLLGYGLVAAFLGTVLAVRRDVV